MDSRKVLCYIKFSDKTILLLDTSSSSSSSSRSSKCIQHHTSNRGVDIHKMVTESITVDTPTFGKVNIRLSGKEITDPTDPVHVEVIVKELCHQINGINAKFDEEGEYLYQIPKDGDEIYVMNVTTEV